MTTVDQLMAATFDRPRTARSEAYKQGARAVFALRIDGTPIPLRYVPGTAELDAFFAGLEEGHLVWRGQAANHGSAA